VDTSGYICCPNTEAPTRFDEILRYKVSVGWPKMTPDPIFQFATPDTTSVGDALRNNKTRIVVTSCPHNNSCLHHFMYTSTYMSSKLVALCVCVLETFSDVWQFVWVNRVVRALIRSKEVYRAQKDPNLIAFWLDHGVNLRHTRRHALCKPYQ
jgi:hypothetical protein